MAIEIDLSKIRKKLHRNAELSGNEFQTAKKIIQLVGHFNPTKIFENIGGAGVLVIFDSETEGPTILFRAELDALPIAEQNDFAHRSEDKQVSHKCGHDGHMTILLGLAEKIDKEPIKKGKVVLLFQPAEEIGAGAQAVLKDNTFQKIKPDYVFALHNLPGYPLHQIVVRKNHFTASVKSLIVKLYGETSHAAEPENGCNPALAMASIIRNMATLENKNPDKADFSLITPVQMKMGDIDYGTSPGYGEIRLTMRTWNEDQLSMLNIKVSEIIRSIAKAFELEVDIDSTHHFVANKNHSDAVDLILQTAKESSLSLVQKTHPFKWGEDFGLLTQKYKGAMFGLGAGQGSPALHNPEYDFPDDIISTGANIFYKITQKILS